MDAQRVMGLATSKATLDFEKEVVVGATWDDLDPDVIEDYTTTRQERVGREINETPQQLLRCLGAMTTAGDVTVAGILLFGKDPQQFLPQSGITYVRFARQRAAGALRSSRGLHRRAGAGSSRSRLQVLVVELRGESRGARA